MDTKTYTTNWRDKEYLTINDITKILGLSRQTVAKRLKDIPHIRLSRKAVRIPTAAFEKYLKDTERASTR